MLRKLSLYIFIAFGFTWTIIIGEFLLYRAGYISQTTRDLIYNLGSLGPIVAALICIRRFHSARGLQSFKERLHLNVSHPFVRTILISPILLFFIGLGVHAIATGDMFTFAITEREFQLTDIASYLTWAFPFFAYALFEEPGWRGYLLPLLQSRFSAFAATLITTIVWALWHAPMFLFRFQFSPGIAVGFFFGLFCGSIILTVLFNISRGSIAIVILFHFLNNATSAFDRQYIVATISTGFILLAILLIWRFGLRNMSDSNKVTVDIYQ